MKKEICECCKGNSVQPDKQGKDFKYTWTCPYCDKTGFITYKWWEWILLCIYRKAQEIDEKQMRRR